MKRLTYIVIALVALFFGVTFAFQNNQILSLKYYFDLHWTAPVSVVLLAVFATGMIVGFLAAARIVLRMQRQLVQARKEVVQVEKEVNNLRALPIKDVV